MAVLVEMPRQDTVILNLIIISVIQFAPKRVKSRESCSNMAANSNSFSFGSWNHIQQWWTRWMNSPIANTKIKREDAHVFTGRAGE